MNTDLGRPGDTIAVAGDRFNLVESGKLVISIIIYESMNVCTTLIHDFNDM